MTKDKKLKVVCNVEGAADIGDDGKKKGNTRYVNIQVLEKNDKQQEELGIGGLKWVKEGEYYKVINVDSTTAKSRGTIKQSYSTYKYAARRHGILEDTKILEINGNPPAGPTDNEKPTDAFRKQAFREAVKNKTHTISLKIEDPPGKSESVAWFYGNQRWKVIRYELSPDEATIGFRLQGTSISTYPRMKKLRVDHPANDAGLLLDNEEDGDKYDTQVKYMAYKPKNAKGIHFGVAHSSSRVSTGDAQKPGDILISKTTTPWTAWRSDYNNAQPAPGSGTIPIDIFRGATKKLELVHPTKNEWSDKMEPIVVMNVRSVATSGVSADKAIEEIDKHISENRAGTVILVVSDNNLGLVKNSNAAPAAAPAVLPALVSSTNAAAAGAGAGAGATGDGDGDGDGDGAGANPTTGAAGAAKTAAVVPAEAGAVPAAATTALAASDNMSRTPGRGGRPAKPLPPEMYGGMKISRKLMRKRASKVGRRRKGTGRKGTRRKGTRRKGTGRKGTRHKGTGRKGTRHKGTRHKGTRRN